jgi:DNA-binding NarL/FixJ family response regulator
MLEPEFKVVGSFGDGYTLLKAAEELTPDLVLVDVGMPMLNGVDKARKLKKSMAKVNLIFLTMSRLRHSRLALLGIFEELAL